MSMLTELIEELCPDGVEYRTIEELFDTRNGYTPSRSNPAFWVEEGIPWFRMDDIRTNGNILNDSLQHISPEAVKGGKLFPAGTVIVATSATIGEHALLKVPALSNQRFTALITKPEFSELLLPEFVHYYCFILDDWCMQNTTQSSFASVDMPKFRKFRFPVPPLKVQQEIVRVLNTFTDLEQSLMSELEQRKKQFAFYSDLLMEPKVSDSWAKLGDTATIVRGASPRPIKNFIVEGDAGIPWIKIGDVPDEGKYVFETAQKITEEGARKSRSVAPGDFILSNSMSFGRPYISQIHGCIHDGWLAISSFEKAFRSDYLYYLLRSRPVQVEFARRAGAGTVKNLNADIVRSVVVPAPPLSEQDDVVAKLDSFSQLIQSIEREIALRRKQHEFYRDKLLTFKAKEA